MLEYIFHDILSLGIAQALVTMLLALAVTLLARWQGIHLERETAVALLRGIVQVVATGSVLLFLLRGPGWTSVIVLLAMMVMAANIAARRAQGIQGAFWVALQGIVLGAGSVIALMTGLGVIATEMSALIPIGSMIIASAMNASALALDRFRSEVASHVGQIEAALALGAQPNHTLVPYVQAAVHASLIPRIDSLRSLGIVWIPGLMAGMIVSGSDPIYAAIYQFVVIAMLFIASGLTSVASALLIRSHAFSPAQQLVLRLGEEKN